MGAWLVGGGTVCFIEWLGGEGEFVLIDRSFFVVWWGVGVGEGGSVVAGCDWTIVGYWLGWTELDWIGLQTPTTRG
jgi:hypothetical protein